MPARDKSSRRNSYSAFRYFPSPCPPDTAVCALSLFLFIDFASTPPMSALELSTVASGQGAKVDVLNIYLLSKMKWGTEK